MSFFSRLFRRKPESQPAPPASAGLENASREVEDAQRVENAHSTDESNRAQVSAQRVQRAVESILDSEALTQDLDDEAAALLVQWGVAWAERLAQATTSIQEDEASEQALAERLRAVRQMMRATSRWAAAQAAMDPVSRVSALRKILEQAAQAQDAAFLLPGEKESAEWADKLAGLGNQPAQAVAELRKLLENPRHPIS